MELKDSKTQPIAFRVPIKVYVVLKRRASKQGLKVNKYVKNLVNKDAMRKR